MPHYNQQRCTPFGKSTHLTPEIHSDLILTCISHPALSFFSDPRGGHVLPQTTDLLSAPDLAPHYPITLGFRKDSLILKKSNIWPSLLGVCTVCAVFTELYWGFFLNLEGLPTKNLARPCHNCKLAIQTHARTDFWSMTTIRITYFQFTSK